MNFSPLASSEILHRNVANIHALLVAHSTTSKLLPDAQISLHECQLKSTKNNCICLPRRNTYTCECPNQEEINLKTGKCAGNKLKLSFKHSFFLAPTKFVLMALRDQFVRFKISQHPRTFEDVYTQVSVSSSIYSV